MAERLIKSENAVEKYRKQVDEFTDLRGEMKVSLLRVIATSPLTMGQHLRAEHATLTDATANIEAQLKKTGLTTKSIDSCHSHVATMEQTLDDQASQVRARPGPGRHSADLSDCRARPRT
jgi:hypothetical protein